MLQSVGRADARQNVGLYVNEDSDVLAASQANVAVDVHGNGLDIVQNIGSAATDIGEVFTDIEYAFIQLEFHGAALTLDRYLFQDLMSRA